LENTIKEQTRAVYIANNYYRIDDSSFNNEKTFINDNFADIKLPESDLENKRLINTVDEFNDEIKKANGYKNFYKVGDVVIKPSDYNISKDDICYRDYKKSLSNDSQFKIKYPECMVCDVNNDSDYTNTKSWKTTKTNIQKVCLFNPNAPSASTILNYNGCKKLCGFQ